MPNAIVSWSGGKDSCYAAIKTREHQFSVKGFLSVLSAEGETSRAHGIPLPVLQAQADAAGVSLVTVAASWVEYEQKFTDALKRAKEILNVSHVVFGDIDLAEHRQWEEKVCQKAGLTALLPLWQQDRTSLVRQMIDEGMQMRIVSCNTKLGERFLGKYLTTELVQELEGLGIDPCGERGEFHTLVTHCNMFQNPFEVAVTNTYLHDDYWYAKLELQSSVIGRQSADR